MTENPWTKVGRVFWKEDPEFLKFDKKINTEYFTFEEAWKFSTLESRLKFSIPLSKVLRKMKKKWLTVAETMIGTDALIVLAAILPYKQIQNREIFTVFQVIKMNLIYRYINRKPVRIPWKGGEYDGKIDQDTIEHASWWWTYQIYEYQNNLPPILF